MECQHVLHENNITICCILETHLQPYDVGLTFTLQMTKRCPLMLYQLLKTITLLLAISTVIHRAGDMTT